MDSESTYAGWDLLRIHDRGVRQAPNESIALSRMRHRVGGLEALLRRVHHDPSAAKDLGDEIRRRLRYWGASAAPGLDLAIPPRFLRLRETDPVPLRFLKGALYALLTADVYLAYAGSWAVLVPPVPLFTMALIAFMADRSRRILSGYTRRQACTRCAYDLRGCPQALASESVEGLCVGPVVCPECGAAWPLVPPRVPGG